MNCPKCGNEQTGTLECDRCGIIFEKYQRKKTQANVRRVADQPSPPLHEAPRLKPAPARTVKPVYAAPKPWWTPEGRMGRKLFFLLWLALITTVLVIIALTFTFGPMVIDEELGYALLLIGTSLCVVAALILQSIWIIKRLHDLGKSGRWFPLCTLFFFPLIYLFLAKGETERNQFGDPHLWPPA